MKKWIISILLAVIVSVSLGFGYVYSKNMNDEQNAAQKAEDQAKQRFHIDQVKATESYHGTDSYYVITGIKGGQKMYFWIPDDPKKGKFFERSATSGMTSKEAVRTLNGMNLDVRKMISVKLGAINGQPIWEITFLNSEGQYNYVSIYFDNGKEAQRILNL